MKIESDPETGMIAIRQRDEGNSAEIVLDHTQATAAAIGILQAARDLAVMQDGGVAGSARAYEDALEEQARALADALGVTFIPFR